MQILVLTFNIHTTPRGCLGNTLKQLSQCRHGAVIRVEESMSLKVLEINGDELPPVFTVDGDGNVTYVGEDT